MLTGEDDLESMDFEPVDLCLAAVRELTEKWLVDMAEYISNNPLITVFYARGLQQPLMELQIQKLLKLIFLRTRMKTLWMTMIQVTWR